jgi:hypothetical protein
MKGKYLYSPCTCEGSNENCSRCYGTGWVSGRKSSGPGSVKRIREKPKPLTSSADIAFVPPKLFDCAECNFTGTAEGFATHMAQWHQKFVSTNTRPGGQKTRSQARVTNNTPNEPFAFCKIGMAIKYDA